MRDAVLGAWRRVCELSPLDQDALLYLASAVFAALLAATAKSSDYRVWGEVASPAYLVGALWCAAARRRLATAGARARRSLTRRLVAGFLVLGAVALPLLVEVAWRAEARPGVNAQPEAAVVAAAGYRLATHGDPYPSAPDTIGVLPRSDAAGQDARAYFPYLPGMAVFGLGATLPGPAELRDARLALAGFTLVVAALVLAYPGTTLGRRGRVLQVLVILPTGSLAMVTGGDDLPVLVLMLLGLVLAERRRPVLAGLAMGLDATLKLTAWPVALLLVLAARDRRDRPAGFRYAAAAALVVVPTTAAAFAVDPSSFVLNVVRFPLGLAPVRSPAASPLVGQVLVSLLPQDKRLITVLLLAVGLAAVLVALRRHTPRTPGEVAGFCCFAMALATVLAPATRFGYLIYPANLLAWTYLLEGMRSAERQQLVGQSASLTSYTDSESVLVGACCVPPPSAGESDGVDGVTVAPTSQ